MGITYLCHFPLLSTQDVILSSAYLTRSEHILLVKMKPPAFLITLKYKAKPEKSPVISAENGLKTVSQSNRVVIALWTAVLLIVGARVALFYSQHNAFVTYVDAGRKWIESQPLYSTTRGFVYSPLIAACFAPFTRLPGWIGALIWRLLTVTVFIGANFWWLRAGLHNRIPRSSYWLVFLMLLPLSLGNFNNGQVNPLLIGVLMIAVLAAYSKRWVISAVCIGIAAYLKIYPLAVGLLLVLIYPRQLGWRSAVALILLGALPFVLQQPAYVYEQYQRWFSSRSVDHRGLIMNIGMVMKALCINPSPNVFMAIQILAGAALAAVCQFGRLKKWNEERLLVCLFTLGSCWMLLFGPATEDATYVMLAPALVFALVQCFHQSTPSWMRISLCTSFAILLLAQVLSSYFSYKKGVYSMAVEPLGALIFAVCAIPWIFTSSLWNQHEHA